MQMYALLLFLQGKKQEFFVYSGRKPCFSILIF